MKPLGRNITVKPDDTAKFRNGIWIPDTVEPNREWGTVVDGRSYYGEGDRVYYFSRGLYEKEGIKILPLKKVIICEPVQEKD